MSNEIQLGSKSVKASEIKQISIARNVGLFRGDLPLATLDVFGIVCHDKNLLTDEDLKEVNVDELEWFVKQHPELQFIENAKVSLKYIGASD